MAHTEARTPRNSREESQREQHTEEGPKDETARTAQEEKQKQCTNFNKGENSHLSRNTKQRRSIADPLTRIAALHVQKKTSVLIDSTRSHYLLVDQFTPI